MMRDGDAPFPMIYILPTNVIVAREMLTCSNGSRSAVEIEGAPFSISSAKVSIFVEKVSEQTL